MKKSNIRFLSSLVVFCTFSIANAYAVPSVKMLGTNPARVGVNSATVKQNTPTKTNTVSTPQRLGSIRAQTATTGTLSNRVSSASGSSDSNRLGFKVAPYIQSGNAVNIKPNQAPAINPTPSPADVSGLEDRIISLEDAMPTKQNELAAGEGIVLDNNTISVDEGFAELPNRVNALSDDIDGLAAEIGNKLSGEDLDEFATGYYTKAEIDAKVQDISAGDVSGLLDGKQDKINDLTDIRAGAAAGNTAVQPSTLNNYLTTQAAQTTYQPIGDYATKAELQNVVAPDMSGYLTITNAQQTYQPIGTYIANPSLPSDSGDFMLVVNRDENGNYVYSWKVVNNTESGSGGTGGGWGFDDSNW